MEKLRFMHISDVLLGAEVDQGSMWCEERTKEIYDTFVKIIDSADRESVDFMFIAGNLFDHQPSEPELDWLDTLLRRLKHTVVVYAAGYKDHLGGDAPLLSYKWTAPVCVLGCNVINSGDILPGIPVSRDDRATVAVDHLAFPGLNLDVYGASYYGDKMTLEVIDDVVPDRESCCNILMACGGKGNKLPIDWNKIRNNGFDYVALGGRQKYYPAIAGKAYYPGSPEAVSSESLGAHGYIYGEFRNGRICVEFRKIAAREYKRVDYPVDNRIGDMELGRALQRLLDAEGKNNIYTINIIRSHGCEKSFDISDMMSDYRILHIQDEKFVRMDYSEYIRANRNNEFGELLEAMNSAGVEEREGIKLAVDSLIDISGLYMRSNKRMGRELFRTARGQALELLSARRTAYENDAVVKEYEQIRGDYEISPDVLEELNSVWARERGLELEITTVRRRLEELPKQYRRRWIRMGVRAALIPAMLLGILSIIILSTIVTHGEAGLPDGRMVYAMMLAVIVIGVAYYTGYAVSKYPGWKRKGGQMSLTTEINSVQMELDKLCDLRNETHDKRLELQSLDGHRRDMHDKLTVREKMLGDRFREMRVTRRAIEFLKNKMQ